MKKQFKKWGIFSFIFILCFALISGCGTKEEEKEIENLAIENNEEKTDASEGAFPLTITDDAGREVTIDEEPQTIVSIQASTTEVAFALGLEDKIIGVSDFCNYPVQAQDIQKVGAQDINAEVVLSLMPDLALVTDYHYNSHPQILQQFEDAGIDVVVIGSASSFDDAYKGMELIGSVTGTKEKADEIITDMKNRHQALKEKAASITDKKRVWVEVSPAPDIYTTGKNTFLHEMLESIQAVNVAEDFEGWVKLTEEEIIRLNPDVIITTYGYYIDDPSAGVLARQGWKEVPAIKNENVFDVDNDTVTRPGPRLIEGVETLAELIYPETFKQ